MYRVLVVDDDATCLTVAKASLKKCNYEVMAVTHALEALSILGEKGEEEKSYDVVLADVHMPVMDGFELLQRVNNNFNIPVILISADNKTEVISKGFRIGAPAYLIKPVTTEDVRHLWQFSVLWQKREKNAYRRFNEARVPRSICSSSTSTETVDKPREKKTNKPVWNANLHSRFVEAILILGPKNAVPRNIVEVMNVIPSLSREQVASHLQKFRKFLERVLDGHTNLDEISKYWIDCTYYSRIVGGNPNMILINQLQEMRRTGKMAAPIPASLPLPPLHEAEASSSGSRNAAMLLPNNYASSSSVHVATPIPRLGGVAFHSAVDVATPTPRLDGVTSQNAVNLATPTFEHVGATFQCAGNLDLENIVGSSSTYNNLIHSLNYEGNQLDYYNQHTAVPQHNYHLTNVGLTGGANDNMFPATNSIGPSSGTTPIRNHFISKQPFNVGSEGNNILFGENNFNNADLQIGNVQLHNPNTGNSFASNQFGIPLGMNIEQMVNVQPDPYFWNVIDAYQFGNTNQQAPQFGADGSSIINNNSGLNNIPAANDDQERRLA